MTGSIQAGVIILCAFALDLIFGDPRWFPHPVRGIGWWIQRIEPLLRKPAKKLIAEKAAGIVLVISVVLPVYFLAHFLIFSGFQLSPYLGIALSILMAYTTLATKGLGDAARSVLARLDVDDLGGARKELSVIVGRDTEKLDEPEVVRAAVETVAENASDGVVAPLFYLAIGGPALALAYKAVNTLDSVVGYKNEKYINFGWAAARLDDMANYIPARITAVLICLASGILRRLKPRIKYGAGSAGTSPRPSPLRGEGDSAFRTPHSGFQSAWKIMLRDGRNHPSPNSGYPEAAVAGALGVRLGGTSFYGGKISPKPFIGDDLRAPCKKDIALSVRLLYCSSLPAVLAAALGAAVLRARW